MPKSRRERRNNDGIPVSASAASRPGEDLWEVLARTYGRLRGAAKVLAEDGDASEAAAGNWLRKRNLPQYESLIALMAANPDVNDAVRRAVARRAAATDARRAAWRSSYDAALAPLPAAEGSGGGGLDRGPVDLAGGPADQDLRPGVTVDRRRGGGG